MPDPREYQVMMEEQRRMREEQEAALGVLQRREAANEEPTEEEEERYRDAQDALDGINLRINRFMEEQEGSSGDQV
jgi:hypothetical protein